MNKLWQKSAFEKKFGVAERNLKKLGEGHYGVVYLHETDGVKSAVKVIEKKKLKTQNELDNLNTEIDILRHLSSSEVKHPHIVNFIDSFSDKKRVFVLLEVVEGGELFDRIVQKNSYSEKEACQVIKNIAEGLNFIHQQHIVHRDLKPENLLLVSKDNDTNVKIADFGFAAFCNEPLQAACGTLVYVAPEVLKSQEYRTEPDMWSLGVITYVLLCGYPPFFSPDQAELSEKIIRGKTKFLKDDWKHVSKEAKDLIKVLMIRKMHHRSSAADLLNHPWIVNIHALNDEANEAVATELRKFKAKLLFSKAVNAVMAVNQMREMLDGAEMEENSFEDVEEML